MCSASVFRAGRHIVSECDPKCIYFGQGIPLNLLISTVSEYCPQKNYQKERKYVECPCGSGAYCYICPGFADGTAYTAENGLLDLINENVRERLHYPPIHLSDDNVEVVIAHSRRRKGVFCG